MKRPMDCSRFGLEELSSVNCLGKEHFMLGMKWAGNVPLLDKECSESATLYWITLQGFDECLV